MITLSMIVKNEEKYLKECLNSVTDVVDEIVIVDTGSNDKTINIAKEFGAKIFNFKWIDDFAAARNFSLKNSSGDWILYLDADERLEDSSKEELKSLTKINSKCAYLCKVKSVNSNHRASMMSYVRLFPNDKNLRFEGKIHEQIEEPLKKRNYSIRQSGIEILHLGYNISKDNLKEKAGRNLSILIKEYKNNPSSYYAFQLGQTYGILNDKEKAEKFFNLSLKDANLKNEYRSLAYRYLSVNSLERNDWNSALSFIERSISADCTQPIALIVAAKIHLHFNRFKDACYFCKQAFLMNEEYLSGKLTSHQAILLDRQTILEEGINIAVSSSDKELFKFFYNKIPFSLNSPEREDKYICSDLFNKLFDNLKINESELKLFEKFIMNENNALAVINLLENYSHKKEKLSILNSLYSCYPDNTTVISKYALELEKNNNLTKATELLERSIALKSEDPAVIFYLISIYLKNKQFENIPGLIHTAEEKYKYEPVILSKINTLKEKLAEFVK